MTDSAEFRSGKGAGDENFPVASWLIARKHRFVIRAFYDFVRTADDVADHPAMPGDEKLARLDALEESLLGRGDELEGVALRAALERHDLSPVHAQDLLRAFRQDVTKRRYADWDELIDYCAYSAMPVGRFVLDVHGEQRSTWPASDALCAALQIINHLQDCGADYKNLNRVYVPLDALAAHGAAVEALGEVRATPELRAGLLTVVTRTAAVFERSRGLPASVADTRLALEISVIRTLAARLLGLLAVRDPLSEPVHLNKAAGIAAAAGGVTGGLLRRLWRPRPRAQRYQTQ